MESVEMPIISKDDAYDAIETLITRLEKEGKNPSLYEIKVIDNASAEESEETEEKANIFTVHIKLSFLETKVNLEMDKQTSTLLDLLKAINHKYSINLSESIYFFSLKSDEDDFEFGINGVDNLVYNQTILDHKLYLK